MDATPEQVASELKRLVGWGASPKRLALYPALRAVSGVSGETPVVQAGYQIRRFIIEAIDRLDSPQQFQGRLIEADRLRRALRLLLMLEGSGQSAPNRRARAIMVLGVYVSVEQWRRPFGPERELMQLLAEYICEPPTVAQAS